MSIYDSSKALASKLIGKFKNPNQLEFQESESIDDGMGGVDETWTTKFICDGAVLTKGGVPASLMEKMVAMQLTEITTHVAYIEVESGTPTHKDRLFFKGVYYNITGVLNIGEADAVYTVLLKKGVAI